MRPDPLHELIHSLTANERRYFRLHALPGGGQADSNSMRLFEALLAQGTYDEEAVLRAFEGEALTRHLSSEKNYLYRLILRSLRAMTDSGNTRLQVQAEIHNAMLLFQRGLYHQCRKLLAKARKLAEGIEYHLALVEILTWERRLWKILADKGRHALAERLIEAQRQSLAQLEETRAYYDLYDRMFLQAQQKFSLRGGTDDPAWQALVSDPLLSSPDAAHGFEARHFYWLCQAWRHQLEGNAQALFESLTANVALWEEHPHLCEEESARYVQTLSNYLHAAGLVERYEEFPRIFDKIRSARTQNRHGDLQVLQSLHYYELLYALNTADWEAAARFRPAIEAFMDTAGARIGTGRRLAFQYNLCILAFILEQYRDALKWVNAILDGAGAEVREDIQYFARILLIILHFELGNVDLMEYLHRSTYRYLYDRAELHPYERLLLEAMHQILQQPTRERRKAILEQLQTGIAGMMADAPSRPGMQELRCWIEARLGGRPLREVMAEMIRGRHPARGGA